MAQKTAFLYAKNPKAVAKRRERLNATSWDESQTTLTQLMQSGAMMMQQAGAMGMPPGAGGAPMGAGMPPGMAGGMMNMASGRDPGHAADGHGSAAGCQSDDVRRHAGAASVDGAVALDKLDIGGRWGRRSAVPWPVWAPGRSPVRCKNRPALATN